MENFVFHAPTKVFFGKDTHKETGRIIKEYGFKKVLLHFGQSSIKLNGLYDEIVTSLEQNGIEYVPLGGVEPNPKISLVREGIQTVRQNGCELILAVGGGSVIDSAKLIASGCLYDGDAWDFPSGKAAPNKALPVATVLTLAASGSEMSQSSVITNEEINLKRGFGSPFNRPLFSICNPCLTFSVNPYQTACGIVDIMMHTLERYFAVSEPFVMTDQIAEGVLRTVIKYGKRALQDPTDYEARANLMWAGSISHNDLTGLGNKVFLICHQLEHELSGMFDSVSHGAGLSVIYPAWAKYIYKYKPERFASLAENVWGIERDGKPDEKIAYEGIIKTEEFFKLINMPTRLLDFDIEITEEIIDKMSEKCTHFGKRTLPDYIELGKKEIAEIFKLAL